MLRTNRETFDRTRQTRTTSSNKRSCVDNDRKRSGAGPAPRGPTHNSPNQGKEKADGKGQTQKTKGHGPSGRGSLGLQWLDDMAAHEFDAASAYLSLKLDEKRAVAAVGRLRKAEVARRRANDVCVLATLLLAFERPRCAP